MLKILHTADWHLGVRLHKKDLTEDHRLFFNFLIDTIHEKSIDVLLVSGDIFDHANPSQEALHLYYDILLKLKHTGCKVIITGGNHDSPAILNMTGGFLKMMDIHVIGRAEKNLQNQLISVYNKNNEPYAIVCAVPYLRESDIRISESGESHESKQQKRKQGMMQHFEDLVALTDSYVKVPLILMAHLFAAGADTKEQKRDITIGGLDAFAASDFPSKFDYVALGHIHRPMEINGKKHIRYSGSPIALSFSEKNQTKQLVEIVITNNLISEINTIEIPTQRKLVKFSGNFSEVKDAIENYINIHPLKTFAELEIIEPTTDLGLPMKVHELITNYDKEQLDVLTYKYGFAGSRLSDPADERPDIEVWSENELMEELMNEKDIHEEDRVLIRSAFNELLTSIEEKNENQ